MFSLHRRHQKTCRYRALGVRHIKCSCPIWMDGYDERGNRRRISLKTRSWTQAQERLNEHERGAPVALQPEAPRIGLDRAIADYLGDCRARNLQPSTLTSYTKTLEHLATHFSGEPISGVTIARLTAFRNSRLVTPTTAVKELLTLRAFFKFCRERHWITENPAAALKTPKTNLLPTMPFTSEEIEAILTAAGKLTENRWDTDAPSFARARAKALILLLLYSGFRISDAVKLERRAIDLASGRLLVRMMKTRAPLYLRLPDIACAALSALPDEHAYFFWNGRSKLSTAIGNARRTIDRVFTLARITDGHPHRFRDTFSVELLTGGADLRTVQLLLGHTSIRTTEKHYAPFVAAMQRMLDDAVSRLHFGSEPPRVEAVMNADQDTLGNAKGNVLPFPRAQRA